MPVRFWDVWEITCENGHNYTTPYKKDSWGKCPECGNEMGGGQRKIDYSIFCDFVIKKLETIEKKLEASCGE